MTQKSGNDYYYIMNAERMEDKIMADRMLVTQALDERDLLAKKIENDGGASYIL